MQKHIAFVKPQKKTAELIIQDEQCSEGLSEMEQRKHDLVAHFKY